MTSLAAAGMTEPEPVDVFLGLGGNLGDRRANLRAAVQQLRALLGELRVSALYETAPWGNTDQPSFLNAVARGRTTLAPLDLLDQTQAIERELGRQRGNRRWGPRPIDIDILLYGQQTIAHPRLIVPHQYMQVRGFVLRPLADLAPGRTLPNGALVGELLTVVNTDDVRRIEGPGWADAADG